jgi:cyanophycin synthetase
VLNADDDLVAEMRSHCSGSVVLFSMRQDNELVERWVHRGRKAVTLQKGDLGEMMVIREGRRTMPIAWVHQLPATFEGRARMMVQNSLAAAAAAHAAGAHLHDIRRASVRSARRSTRRPAPQPVRAGRDQGADRLRATRGRPPDGGRLRRAHDLLTARRAAGRANVVRQPARGRYRHPRRPSDDDMRELGHVAARYFDEIIVREDVNRRGREPGDIAELIMEGIQEAMRGGRPSGPRRDRPGRAGRDPPCPRSKPAGDVVVLCVDYATDVWKELERRKSLAQPRIMLGAEGNGQVEATGGDPDLIQLDAGP